MGGLVLVRCLLFRRRGFCSFLFRGFQQLVAGLACHFLLMEKDVLIKKEGNF